LTPSCRWTVRELYVNPAVNKGCLTAPFLYLFAIVWIINDKRTAKWNPGEHGEQLYHLGFVDDISLVSSNNHQMQDKTAQLTANSNKLGPCLNANKTKATKANCTNNPPVTMRDTIGEEITLPT